MFRSVVFVLFLANATSYAALSCDIQELRNSLTKSTVSCPPNTTFCQSTCDSGYSLEDGSKTKNHTCNGTSWLPSEALCLPLSSPAMWTDLTVMYETEDRPASECLHSFNVSMRQNNFQDTFQTTCEDIQPGNISVESIAFSALAFQVTSVFSIKFSGSGSAYVREVCMNFIKHLSDANQAYLKPFSSISCGTEHSNVTKKTTTASPILQYSCSEITGTQLVQSDEEFACMPCFPGNYLNVTKCEACPIGQYQSEAGQLTCDNCTTGKHVTEDKRECQDSACVRSFLSQNLPDVTLSCDAQTQTCISSCLSGHIQGDGRQSTKYNCSNGWYPPSKNCMKYEFSTYRMDLELVYQTDDLPASYCLSNFRSVTTDNTASFNATINSSCSLHVAGGLVIENITSTTIAFQVISVFRLKFYGSWPVDRINLCIDILSISFQTTGQYLHPYSPLTCNGGQSNVTKLTIQSRGSRVDCPEGRQMVNSTDTSYCLPCSSGTYLDGVVCSPCPNGTYQPQSGQTFCYNCSDWRSVNNDRTVCQEVTTVNISSETTSLSSSELTTEVTSLTEVTSSVIETNLTSTSPVQTLTSVSVTTTDERTTTESVGRTTQQNITSTAVETSAILSSTTTFISQTTSTTLRTTEAYVIPCGVDRLSLAIQNATLTCAGHNHTCNVTCNTGFVTSDGRPSLEYKCEGELWTPKRELCLRYDEPIRTAQLHFVYETEDQVASTCLEEFQEMTNQNKEQFQNSIADKCNLLGIERDDVKIKNITSSSLAFQLSNAFSVEFSGDEPNNVRNVCLDTIEILFKTIPTLLHPFSPLMCTFGQSNVTKVSARVGNSTYNCNNRTNLVNHLGNIYCVPCPPGMYMELSGCKACPEGTYQSLPGQLSCDTCTGNKSVVDGGTDCREITSTSPASGGNVGKSQVNESTGLSMTEIIIVAVVAIFFVILIFTIATIYYCKKSKTRRKTSHSDVSSSDKTHDDQSVHSDEDLTRSQEKLIPEKADSKHEFGLYSDKNIERSTFTSANETKALDVLKDIIDINIDNDECIVSAPNMTNIQVRKGKWRPIRRLNCENVSDFHFEKEETEKPEPVCRTLSDYDNFQISMPEFSDQETT